MSDAPQLSPRKAAERARRARPGFSAGHYFLLVFLFGAALLVLTDNVRAFASYLYHPYSITILIVIGGMYLMQKGSDRSRIYQMELREMRRRRLEELEFHRQLERELSAALEQLKSRASDADASARQAIEAAVSRLRDKI